MNALLSATQHRTGAMNATDYEVLAVPLCYYQRGVMTSRLEEVSEWWCFLDRPKVSSWSGHVKGTCDECREIIAHPCIVLHRETRVILAVGADCVQRVFGLDWSHREEIAQIREREREALFGAEDDAE